MLHTSLGYRALTTMMVPVVPVLLRDERQRTAHRARLRSPASMEDWARAGRDHSRPLAWFHAPSVGEGLQARAVIQALRALQPDLQVAYTHYSPSAETFAATVGADWSGYLGYDRRRDVDWMLAAIRPSLLVFTKLDLWPELSVRAAALGVHVAMAAGTVSPRSGRLRTPARQWSAPGYQALELAAAISGDDAERLQHLGCVAGRVVVTGDPRVDSVLSVVDAASPSVGTAKDAGSPMTLVAGSTWPEDEVVVLGAFELLRDRHPDARLIIAPHDPSTEHLHRIDAVARELGLPGPVRLGKAGSDDPALVVVDKVGLLARLYGRGAMAYVGGGYGKNGIHSVLEPAAWALPVVIGPNDRDSRDVGLLAAAGALRRLDRAQGVRQLATIWAGWLDDPAGAARSGMAGRIALDAERGAAARTAELLLPLVSI